MRAESADQTPGFTAAYSPEGASNRAGVWAVRIIAVKLTAPLAGKRCSVTMSSRGSALEETAVGAANRGPSQPHLG